MGTCGGPCGTNADAWGGAKLGPSGSAMITAWRVDSDESVVDKACRRSLGSMFFRTLIQEALDAVSGTGTSGSSGTNDKGETGADKLKGGPDGSTLKLKSKSK